MLMSLLPSFLFYPPEALGQVHRMTFLSRHSAAPALRKSRWLCRYGFACMSSPGSSWQRCIARPVLQVLSCQCFFPAWLLEAAPCAGPASLAESCSRSICCSHGAGMALQCLAACRSQQKAPSQCFCSCGQTKQVCTSSAEAEVENESEQTAEIRSSL